MSATRLPKILLAVFALFGMTMACSVKPEKILGDVVGAMCKRLVVCQPGIMSDEAECQKTMLTALSSAPDKLQVKASQKDLDACLKSIAEVDCPNLLGVEPPSGCEFLK